MHARLKNLIERAVGAVDFTNLKTFSDVKMVNRFFWSLPFFINDPAPVKDEAGRILWMFPVEHWAVERMLADRLKYFVEEQKSRATGLADAVLSDELDCMEEAYLALLDYLNSPEWVVGSSPYFDLLKRRFGIHVDPAWFKSVRESLLRKVTDICTH